MCTAMCMQDSVAVQSAQLPVMELCGTLECFIGMFAGGQAGGQAGGEN